MCDISHDFYGETRTLDEATLRAKKPHRCGECCRSITPGETYVRYVGKCDGDFFASKFCMRCDSARKWLTAHGHGWVEGRIRNDVRYCAQSKDRPKLLAEGRRKRAVRREAGL